jgi:hypothetical protein
MSTSLSAWEGDVSQRFTLLAGVAEADASL